MRRITNKPHLVFLLSIPMIMLIGFINGEAALDINVHDTYYIIAYIHLAILISILFGIIGLGYWIMLETNRKLSKLLNLIHITLTIGGFIAIWITSLILTESAEYEFDDIGKRNLIIALILFLMILGQFLYIINLIIGLFKRIKSSG
ncbi:cbb3-type cytochrome c oxidase subunit I [Jejuia spongiicola]|uniref:Cbb3-type cytochrome c oxidase subunit I n=1 Tax=Jejuia spongiicola TaxID=2942207 RepID=A0ABT0QEQ9_9FLAO|nr:cbb3-type cytochrome c oxidase subunit I [Jejuia spongiicola]MCL6295430.1 cbb3-type cytochrome c oxidase subunit I [Jejuia spongiicola]